MVKLSAIDIVFIILIFLFIIRCYLRGFLSEILSMAAIVLGLLASLYFYKNGGAYIRQRFMPEIKTMPEILAFIALFIIVFIVVKLLEILLKGIVQGVKLGGADRFFGIIFGFAEGIMVVSLILFILKIQPLFDPSSIISDSLFAKALLPLITGVEKLKGV